MNAVEAARAYVKTYIDNSAIPQGLNTLKRQLNDLGSSATAWGTAITGASGVILGLGGAAAVQFAGASEVLSDMHQVTGIGVEALGEMSFAAGQLGSDLGSLQGALRKQTKFLGDVNSGAQEAHHTLAQLGLTVDDLAGQPAEEAFGVFADAIGAIDDQTTKVNLAMEVFGRTGGDLLPMLNAGSAGMDSMRKKARELGVVLSSSDVAAGDELADNMEAIKAQAAAASMAIGAALAPALNELIVTAQPLIAQLISWINENDELILQVAAIAAGALGVGGALITAGAVLAGLSAIIGSVVTVGGLLVSGLFALLSPVGLITAGLAGLIASTTDLSLVWESLSATVGDSLGLAAQLIQNGELSLAVELLWAQIQLLWGQGVKWVVGQTGEMVTATIKALSQALDTLGTLIDKTRNSLARTIAAAGEFTGILPDGTSEELHAMQQAGQAGESSLHGLSQSLAATADGFGDLGGSVDELKEKLAALKGEAIEANLSADLKRTEAQAATIVKGKDKPKTEPVFAAPGAALSGTFSSFAGRSLYSGSGGVVETELKAINRNTAETAAAAKKTVRVGA